MKGKLLPWALVKIKVHHNFCLIVFRELPFFFGGGGVGARMKFDKNHDEKLGKKEGRMTIDVKKVRIN